MKNLIVTAAMLLASAALATPQQIPAENDATNSFLPAVHTTYSVDETVFLVVRDENGNIILTSHEAVKGKNIIIKPILILEENSKNNP